MYLTLPCVLLVVGFGVKIDLLYVPRLIVDFV